MTVAFDGVEVVDGGLSLAVGPARLAGLLPRASYAIGGRPVEFRPTRLEADGERWHADDGRVALTLTIEQHEPTGGIVVRAKLSNLAGCELQLHSIEPLAVVGDGGLELGEGPAAWSLYRNGWGSWSNARSYRMDECDGDPWLPIVSMTAVDPETPRDGLPGHFRSEQVGALQAAGADPAADREALVIGFVRGDRSFGVVDLVVDLAGGRLVELVASSRFDGMALDPGASIESEPLLLAGGSDGYALLEQWADAFGAAQRARVPERPPSGWCSWYYYFTSIDQAAMRENLAEIQRIGEEVPFDYLMVDDGHQAAIGDWLTTNDSFPAGMADLAARIAGTGRDAGIWLAPFVADPGSALMRAHPDWVLRDERRRPRRALWNPLWNPRRFMWALDTTRPDVQQWLSETAHTIRHEWGYRVLKLDFLYAAALPGVRRDRRATRATALRAGLEAVRAGAGDDAVLIGCGLPIGPAVGIVDCMRIGTDVAPLWSHPAYRWATSDTAGASTRVAIRNTVNRAFMHGRLWANDPDCLMVRTDRTRLTLAEVRSLVAASALTDGMLVASDRLSTVPADRVELLALAHRLAGGRARVIDLFENSMPELVVSERADDVLIGAFNFGEHTRSVVVDLDRCGVIDLLPSGPARLDELMLGGQATVSGGRLNCGLVPAHDARVVRIPRHTSTGQGI